jgi:S1-C subfamily serine protease
MLHSKYYAVALLVTGLTAVDTPAQPNSETEPPAWRSTLERISSGVVSIKVDSTRAFDTGWNQSSQATGFVVDAQQGLILTNRHVVTPGPVRAEALFLNQEEVDLLPVYRDPVHDFGLFRYDPAALKYIEPAELVLVPEAAQIGREIRVVGNDAGEQLAILSGTIARLRRQAPNYGPGEYNDFNTFYLQAASGTSGGSSGSPVIDIEGQVVALNAGASSMAASSFFLPLDRVKRAVELLRAGEPVTRGTLETVFVHQAFDELRRLGLQEGTEAAMRRLFPDQTGMLVVDQVLPETAASEWLEVGDILVEVDGNYVADFVPLEAILDSRIGGTVSLTIERNGESFHREVPIQDLHAITPDEYIQFGDAVVHDLSYQQARHFNRALDGVYVANPGYVLGTAAIPRGSIIVALNGTTVSDLDSFESAMEGLADRQETAVRYFTFEDPRASKLRIIRMDRRWFPAVRCHRDDTEGVWPCEPLAPADGATTPEPTSASFVRHREWVARAVAPSLVQVHFDMPYTISGVAEQHYYGTGLILDTDLGYVVVDRNTVPESMGDVRIIFAGSLEIPGEVVYIHPLHNLAMLSYDPALIGNTPVKPARLGKTLPQPGDEIWVIGLRGDNKLIHQASQVASIEPVNFPLSRTLRFRDSNMETLALINGPGDIDGVIVDKGGRAVSLWSSFAYQRGGDTFQENKGVPIDLVAEMLDLVREHKPLHSLEVEFRQVPLSVARTFGLSDDWSRQLELHDPDRRQLLSVVRTVAGADAARQFLPGDLLLTIDGTPVSRFREVERAVQRPTVDVQVWRDRQVVDLRVRTVALDGRGTRRAAMWAGALLQAPYRDMSAQRGIEPYGVYVAYFGFGSPASRFGLTAGRRIVAVDGQPTPDLDSFLAAVRDKQDRDSVRLGTVTWNNSIEVLTLKLDQTYWPAYEIAYGENGWTSKTLN